MLTCDKNIIEQDELTGKANKKERKKKVNDAYNLPFRAILDQYNKRFLFFPFVLKNRFWKGLCELTSF